MRTASLLSTLACASSLLAQDSATPAVFKPADTPPAIVLLLKDPLALDVTAWRRQWLDSEGEVLDAPHKEKSWLALKGDTLTGGRRGLKFVVRSISAPRDLADWRLRHLFEDERAELRANRAAIEVAFVGKPPVGESRHDAYRALASIAAALPKRGVCIGFGLADHGTFDLSPDPRWLARFKDPLFALQPESILRLFAAKASAFDVEQLVTAFSKEFGTAFSPGDDKPNTVSVRETPGGRYASVRVGDLDVSIRWEERYDLARKRLNDQTEDAVRQLLKSHRAVLEIRATGPVGEVAEGARYRTLARVAACIWSDDLLGLNWRCSSVVVPVDGSTHEQLRRPDPVEATIGKRRAELPASK